MIPLTTQRWLTSYYFVRAGVAAAWVAAAYTIGRSMPPFAAALLVAYPAWDAAANLADARHSGGLARNPSQTINAVVSIVTALAAALALRQSPIAPYAAFGAFYFLVSAIWLTAARARHASPGRAI